MGIRAEVRIERMTEEDLAEVLQIEQSSHLDPWSRELFIGELSQPQSRCLIARSIQKPAQVLGYVCFWTVADEIQIQNIAVHTAHRRLGVGRFLLEQVVHFGWKVRARCILLEARQSNAAALKLYRSFGFQEIGERADYYGTEKESAIVMELGMTAGKGAAHCDMLQKEGFVWTK